MKTSKKSISFKKMQELMLNKTFVSRFRGDYVASQNLKILNTNEIRSFLHWYPSDLRSITEGLKRHHEVREAQNIKLKLPLIVEDLCLELIINPKNRLELYSPLLVTEKVIERMIELAPKNPKYRFDEWAGDILGWRCSMMGLITNIIPHRVDLRQIVFDFVFNYPHSLWFRSVPKDSHLTDKELSVLIDRAKENETLPQVFIRLLSGVNKEKTNALLKSKLF